MTDESPPAELTERLDLRPVVLADAAEMFVITSDARTWEHQPSGRHQDVARTEDWIRRCVEHQVSDGLSYWSVRRREGGVMIGIGGVQRHGVGDLDHWNLFYRLAPSAWGRGYATELGRAAIAAAHAVDDTVPVIAWILAHNAGSIAVARRLELLDQGPHVDPSDGVERLAFTDRPVDRFA